MHDMEFRTQLRQCLIDVARALRQLYGRPASRRALAILHLTPLLSRWYYRCTKPADGIVRVRVQHVRAQFRVRTDDEFVLLELLAGSAGEKHLIELMLTLLRPGDVAYDVGANMGLYTVFFSKQVGPQGRVIAFEPLRANYQRLQGNVALNRLENVRCFQKALGHCNGTADIYASSNIGNFSLLRRKDAYEKPAERVEVITGDDLLAAGTCPVPRVIKIDVEGYEHAVLRGLAGTLNRPECEFVLCEMHPSLQPAETDSDDLLKLLRTAGFQRVAYYRRASSDIYHVVASKAAGVGGLSDSENG